MIKPEDWKQPPASIGLSVSSIDTPALLIDMDAFEQNLSAVHHRVKASGVALRAHAKAHKSVDIARLQMLAGASGLCCQKASEAQVFVEAGIRNILITNQIVGQAKVERVARLAATADISVCVDAEIQVTQLGDAARAAGVQVGVYIEVDIGHGRCGVTTASAALALAERIVSYRPALALVGIHAFRGSAQHMRQPEDRAQAVDFAVRKIREVRETLGEAGHCCLQVTGGGTGTYELEAMSGVYTEVQPGSYVLMDTDYASNQPSATAPGLRHALFGLCTVISQCSSHAVLDGGLKAFAVDLGLPQMVLPGWTVKSLSDEHAVIVPAENAAPLQIGDKVRLIPSHCDPTVNLHDWLIALRGQVVEDIWPVSARGALF